MDKSNTHSKKKELWRARLARSAEYCGSEREFCEAEGLSIHTFRYWKYKLKQEFKNQELTIQPFAKVQIGSPFLKRKLPERFQIQDG